MELDLFLKKTAKIVEPKIKEVLNTSLDKKFRNLVNYQIGVGGKRLRPSLAILSCLSCGGKINDVLYPAAGLEILHNYTLIIDDMIDNSDLRRGKSTCWKKFGCSIAECVGMIFSVSIFQAAEKGRFPREISGIFAKTLKKIIEGEIIDILFEQRGKEDEPFVVKNRYLKVEESDYILMVGKKTASLIEACSVVGGVCAGANKIETRALKNFGFNLGIAFQIQDDILDILGREDALGKKIGQDIKEKKIGNILILLAVKEDKRILKILIKKEMDRADIKEITNLIKKTKALQNARKIQARYIDKAKENLDIIPQNKWRDFLAEFLNLSLERKK